MSVLRNKVQLIGHLGANPEIIKVKGDKRLVRFSIATNEIYYNTKGEKVTETQWHRVIAWGKLADLVENYLHKSYEVAVQGKLITRSYIDCNGIKRYITEIEMNEILLLRSPAPKPAEDVYG